MRSALRFASISGLIMHLHIDEDITFRRLEILLVFMETGNLARTAEKLETSAVSIHRALHALESGLRCSLFRHEGRNLHPTEAAHALAEVAREVLRSMADGVRSTREVAGYSSDHIRIGSLYSLTNRTIPALVMGIKLRKPDIQAELILGSNADLLQKLRDGAIDAALMGTPDNAVDVESEPIFEDDIYFAAPVGSHYAAMERIDLASCAGERFVTLTEGFVTYSGFVDAFRVAGFSPNVVMKTGDIFSLMNLVSGGMGYTLLPGRVRSVMPQKVQLIPLQTKYLMRQTISLNFLRTRERDPNLLMLLSVCRMTKAELR